MGGQEQNEVGKKAAIGQGGPQTRPIAFVTGSSRGIGAGVAVEFAKAGYDLALNYVSSEEGAKKVRGECEAYGATAAVIQGDISSIEQIERMFEQFFKTYDHVDVLVNNAGITRFAPFLEATPGQFATLVNTDFRGSFFCAQKAARNMVEKGVRGTIINITSNHQTGCWPQANIYGPVKAALNKLTQNAALELAPYGIRMVAVAPGYTRVREFEPGQEAGLQKLYKKLPLNRFCEPWEVGRACVFLAGDAASYITGTCLTMDGGALLPVVPENVYVG